LQSSHPKAYRLSYKANISQYLQRHSGIIRLKLSMGDL
jgi:hypothetical protein